MNYRILITVLLASLLLVGSVSALTWSSASGCWTASDGTYNYVKWNATGTSSYTIPAGVTSIEYLIIGGGGGGGGEVATGAGGSGAGAGGLINGTLSVTAGNTTTVTVGTGGNGGVARSSDGTNGGNSKFHGMTANGGGFGTFYARTGGTGGSGGGQPFQGSFGDGIAGQGHQGGAYNESGSGGGGGSSGDGGKAVVHGLTATGGFGGNGTVIYMVPSEPACYAGGGAGGNYHEVGGNRATCGGGNAGQNANGEDGLPGTSETGGGGGGATIYTSGNHNGGAGGSGLVMIRYSTPGVTPPIVSFTSNVTSGAPPFAVQFNDTSITDITARSWSFVNTTPGNNTEVIFSTLQNPVQLFGSGRWLIYLNVTNASSYNKTTSNYWVNSTDPPIASFTVDHTSGYYPLVIQVTDTSTNTPTSWAYMWGDGTANGTTASASHTYYTAGTYTLNLTVSNAFGTSRSADTTITVHGYPPISNYTYHQVLTLNGDAGWSGDQYNYPIYLDLNTGNGTTSGATVYLNSHSLVFPYDVAITADDGVSKLPLWIDYSVTNATYSRIWTKIPVMAKAGDTNIWVWYGNSTPDKLSDGPNTFQFYDQEGDLTGYSMGGSGYAVSGIELANKTILGTWGVQGAGDCDNNAYIQGALSGDGGATWGSPFTVQDTAAVRDTEAQFIYNGADLYMFYSVIDEDSVGCTNPRPSWLYVKKSTDGTPNHWSGATLVACWTQAFTITSPPIHLASDRWVIPVQYTNVTNTSHWYSSAWYSDDFTANGLAATWTKGGNITDPTRSFDEPAMAQTADGKITALMRDDGIGYYFGQSISADEGVTWSTPVVSNIVSPNARPQLKKLLSGNIMLLWNDVSANPAAGQRHPLSVAILNSSATGITYKRDLSTSTSESHNMGIVQRSNGDILALTNFGGSDKAFLFLEPLIKTGLKNLYTVTGLGTDTSSGVLVASHTGANQYAKTSQLFSPGVALRSRDKSGSASTRLPIGFGNHTSPANAPFFQLLINSGSLISTYSSNATGTASTSGTITDDTSYHVNEIRWLPTSETWIRDNVTTGGTVTTYIPQTPMPIFLGRAYETIYSFSSSIDYMFVRPFASPEPVYSEWSSESNSSSSITADFTGVPLGGFPGTNVTFTGTSSGSAPDNWNWTFGDGNTSTLQNPSNVYGYSGVFDVSLTVSNSTAGSYTKTKVGYITISDSGGATGWNRQDIIMDGIYTFILNIKDSTTHSPIPICTVIDSRGDNTTTTIGVATFSYNYTAVVMYVSSTGYISTSRSYVVDRDRSETIYLTPVTALVTPEIPQQSTWYTPKQIGITVVRRDPAGVHVPLARVSLHANETTLPSDEWLQTAYGMNQSLANQMLNGTLIMAGTTGGDGAAAFTVLSSIGYDVTVTDPVDSATYHTSLYPSDYSYTVWIGANPLSINTTATLPLNNTALYITQPDVGNVTLNLRYQDRSGSTSNLHFIVKAAGNMTTVWDQNLGNPGTAVVYANKTYPNIRGNAFYYYYNATRNV